MNRENLGRWMIVVGVFSLVSGWAVTSSAQELGTPPSVPPEQRFGQLFYGKYCSGCHGQDLKGTKKGPPFINPIYLPGHHGDRAFFAAAANGARQHHWKFGNMKPVKGTDDMIVATIVKYVRYVQKAAGLY